jgi:spore coat polysaccharide biosynthesis predicted glycosyltransferase SpsG
MRIVFRADADREIGAGHIMRSLALATEAVKRGHDCFFIGEIRDLNWVKKAVEKVGFNGIFENPLHFIPDFKTDVLVLDSYHIPPLDPQLQKNIWHSVVVIGDALTPPYLCDLFIHPGIDDHWIAAPEKTFSGFDYLLLRPEIRTARGNKANMDGQLEILISGGGGDAFDFCQTIGKELDKIESNFVAHFFSNSVVNSGSGKDFRNYPLGPKIDDVRKLANLAITTASTSCLEFIAAEIPTAMVCTVDNQEEYFRELSIRGLALPVGTFSVGAGWNINSKALQDFIGSKDKQQELLDAISGKIDFKGASRILDKIEDMAGDSIF